MANSVDPDETACHEPSHLYLYCLQMHLYKFAGIKRLTVPEQIDNVIIEKNAVRIVGYANTAYSYQYCCYATARNDHDYLT